MQEDEEVVSDILTSWLTDELSRGPLTLYKSEPPTTIAKSVAAPAERRSAPVCAEREAPDALLPLRELVPVVREGCVEVTKAVDVERFEEEGVDAAAEEGRGEEEVGAAAAAGEEDEGVRFYVRGLGER